ncbi:M4 family metallopeptidase [Streptomyces sp. NBC_00237]|uniref:M4 family metallopeptidase n=1 Tax=Streptomyces sp. NBC_00237 TaxID=2975687 RepID=UPI00225170B7|nr:M4 family metallopeptidase [Streptomyces sp. NBC_00237]MCX5205572.1 M4 family metallopeptidase [Streptomyces sp. NBC_00237]
MSLALTGLPAPTAQAAASDPASTLVAGKGTATPQLVSGLAEPAPGSPANAARTFLAAHPDLYRIDPEQLTDLATERTPGGGHTVRFQQRVGGIPVRGAQYVVRLTGDGAGQRVESAGGKYFTGLTAPTTATAPAATLRDLARGSLTVPRARAGATVEDHGRVILPGGSGRLTQHFTVRGTDPATGARLAREVYVDAAAGTVALAHDTRPASGPRATAAAAAAGAVPATGTAPDILGRSTKVNIGRLPDGSYQLTDLTRPAAITTYDAAGRDYLDGIPAGSPPMSSPSPDFPATAGSSGATNAHLNAAAVYDFYRDRLGRDGLDGKNGPITSLVNTSEGGEPFSGAFLNGTTMVYGNGGPGKYPYSVALDVAGHEMTHAVIDHTADLVATGQPGAMNEALADYFGNAIEVTARGMSMDDPRAALLGESLCRTGTPQACATRRMDDRRTMKDHFLGASSDIDNGGVHLNSTIFSGALWDLRRALDPLTADRLVYRALTGYLTPLDDFVDGRNAVLAAARELKLTRAQLQSVATAFDTHGIRSGWERGLGLDSHMLLRDAASEEQPAVAGGRWVMRGRAAGKTSDALFTGSTTGTAAPTRLSPDDGRTHSWPATDGRSVAWLAIDYDAQGNREMEVLTRSLSGGPVRSLFRSARWITRVQVSGSDVAFQVSDESDRKRVRLSRNGAPAVELPLTEGHTTNGLTLKDGTLGWTESWTARSGEVDAPTVYSIATGKVTAQYVAGDPNGGSGSTTYSLLLVGKRLLWVQAPDDPKKGSSIRSGALNGSGATDVLPADSPFATAITGIAASDQAITFDTDAYEPAGGWSHATLPKFWQLPITGGTPQRLSCNRGSQQLAAADQGTRVLWLDSTAGRTDLVVRNRPAGSC